ncbi:MAG: pyrroline-5-carboxylate reductase [bacterium]
MNNLSVAFIGGGNMARALIGGLLQTGWAAERIKVSEPLETARQALLALDPALILCEDNQSAVEEADIVVLAVKPQVMKDVLTPLAASFTQSHPVVISIAAGIREHDVSRWAGSGLPVVRCMPNTPSLVRHGATGLYANALVGAEEKQWATELMGAVGQCVWVEDEDKLDAVTALSGSGPAYIFLVIEAMEEAGIRLGLEPDTARQLSIQNALGAASLASSSNDSPAELREKVTSPGGTTEQALITLEEGGLRALFDNAMQAAAKRADELATELGKN